MGDFTPLDYNKISSPATDGPKKSAASHLPNVLLITALVAFTLSLTYSVQTYQISVNTQAATEPTPIVVMSSPTPAVSRTFVLRNKPTKYKSESVDSSCLQSDMGQEKALDVIAKYYSFKDILNENGIAYTPSTTLNCESMDDDVDNMSTLIQKQLLSTADFAYVEAKFKDVTIQNPTNPEENAQTAARRIVTEYKKKFEQSSAFQQVITQSNSDSLLKQLNGSDKSQVLQDYTAENDIFADLDFNSFLFTQTVKQTSDLYTLKDKEGSDMAYIVVYPTKITKKKYISFNDILIERGQNFSYNQ